MPAAPQIAFSGGYADFKLVKTRQVAQVIVEIPLASAQEFVKLFGLPNPATEDQIAIAKIKPGKVIEGTSEPKERRDFADLPAATQAALNCKEPRFWAYLREEHDYHCSDENDAAAAVRHFCKVHSRGELTPRSEASHRWGLLASHYQAWNAAERVGA